VRKSRFLNSKHDCLIAITVAVCRALLPSFYRVFQGIPMLGVSSAETGLIVTLFIINSLFFWMNTMIFLAAVYDIRKLRFYARECGAICVVREESWAWVASTVG